jgi:hypothetical protein
MVHKVSLPTLQSQALASWMKTNNTNSDTATESGAGTENSTVQLLQALVNAFKIDNQQNQTQNQTKKQAIDHVNRWANNKFEVNLSTQKDHNNQDNNEDNNEDNNNDLVFLCLLEILLSELLNKNSQQLSHQTESSFWNKLKFYVLGTLMGIFTSTEAFGSGLLIAGIVTNKFSIAFIIATAITLIAIGLVCTIEIKNMANELGITYLEAKEKYVKTLLLNQLNIKIGGHLEDFNKLKETDAQSQKLDSDFFTHLETILKNTENNNTNNAEQILEFFNKHKNRRRIIKYLISFFAANLNAAITYMTAVSSIKAAAGFAFSGAVLSTPLGIAIASIIVLVWILTYLFSWYCFERKVMTGSLSGLLSAEKETKVELRAIAGKPKDKDPHPRSPASFYANRLKEKLEFEQLKSDQKTNNLSLSRDV